MWDDLRWRVVFTRPDHSVGVICPSVRCVEVLKEGGGIACIAHAPQLGIYRYGLWEWLQGRADAGTIENSRRTGYLPLALARAWEIEKFVRDPAWHGGRADRVELAVRWIDARIHGGLNEWEAIALIGDFSAPADAEALEIVHVDDLPQDRVHRDAWRRSRNGGPVWVDEDAATRIDEARLWAGYEAA